MAAGEHEPQPVVGQRPVEQIGRIVTLGRQPLRDLLVPGFEARASPDAVDRLEAACRNEPGARIVRYAIPRPLRDCRREGLGERLLGEIEVAEQPDQRRENAARFVAIERVEVDQSSTNGRNPPQIMRFPSNGIFFGSMYFAKRGSFMIFFMIRSRCPRDLYTMKENTTTSLRISFTLRGNEVRLPQLTSSASASTYCTAPYSSQILPANFAMRR
jgi:hypothetical protein